MRNSTCSNSSPGVSNVEVQAESVREPAASACKEAGNTANIRAGRSCPPCCRAVERVIACAPEQCTLQGLRPTHGVIGYDVSEQLDREPAKYFRSGDEARKAACKHCEEGGVAAAQFRRGSSRRVWVSDRVVIDALVEKYCDHLPLYRQSAILEREAGVEISRATMDGWVMRVGELLTPITEVMRRELLGGSYIQADERRWMCRCTMGGDRIIRPIYGIRQTGRRVGVRVPLGRGRDGPKNFLDNSKQFCRNRRLCRLHGVGGRRWSCRMLVAREKEVFRSG